MDVRLYRLEMRLKSGELVGLLKHATGTDIQETIELLQEADGDFVIQEEK